MTQCFALCCDCNLWYENKSHLCCWLFRSIRSILTPQLKPLLFHRKLDSFAHSNQTYYYVHLTLFNVRILHKKIIRKLLKEQVIALNLIQVVRCECGTHKVDSHKCDIYNVMIINVIFTMWWSQMWYLQNDSHKCELMLKVNWHDFVNTKF